MGELFLFAECPNILKLVEFAPAIPVNNPYVERISRRISYSTNGASIKQCIFQKSRAYSIAALDAPAQGASFYVEKI